jgi:hypothetical protein
MIRKTKKLMFFIQHPPENPALKRFVKYAQSQSKNIEAPLSKREKYLLQKFDLFTYQEEFKEKIGLLRKRYKIPDNGFRSFDDAFIWVQQFNEKSLIEYENQLSKLHRGFYIDKRWLELVEYWLVIGSIDIYNIIPAPVKIEYFDDQFTGKPEMFLRIYPDTQQKDLVNSWDMIEKYQGLEPVKTDQATPQSEFKNIRSQTRSNIIRKENAKDRASTERVLKSQKRAFELQRDGKSYVDIAKILNAENLTKSCTYSDVGNLIRRFKLIVHKNKLN